MYIIYVIGSIINVGSIVGSDGNVGQSGYSASKSGLIGVYFSYYTNFKFLLILSKTVFLAALRFHKVFGPRTWLSKHQSKPS